jgi:ATP-dependent RNA helicase SUPV3L1/SUV3
MLGPTNTGKTYNAIEHMLSYDTGMIGFPLRLLARENYEKIVRLKGRHQVALVTGEEKIIPAHARYYCCTVESMPVDQTFDFIAIDEIQLAEDPDRGHIFTDRLLRTRGRACTMFMGAETMRPILASLLPDIEFQICPRFSNLVYTGYKKLTRMPKRSAVVAFSIDDVYNTAELLRRQRGGTAVVLGALSPRTRNAQVEMYQSGEVDFIVATDAIGMGLSMDIHHVALASTRKYDGNRARPLKTAEIAQIAGRAGRFRRDGTFGVTGRVPELDPDIVEGIESHSFTAVRELCWRNSTLEFSSVSALLRSLEVTSGDRALIKGRPSDDLLTLKALMERDDIMVRADNPHMVRLLWDVCQVPDFRQTLNDAHQELVAGIFLRLCENRLEEDWVNAQISRLDDIQGDVDTLTARIAHIRTWTYISYKAEWLQRAEYWQDKARTIEDKLSDALHDALIKRFVDHRASMLIKSLDESNGELLAGIRPNGEVIVESHLIGHLHGFRFIPDNTGAGADHRAVMGAARAALKSEIKRRLAMILSSKPEQFQINSLGQILWQQKHGNPLPGEPIATLTKGQQALKPALEINESDLLAGTNRAAVHSFLQVWLNAHIASTLETLVALENPDGLQGAARGIAFQIYESLGILPREKIEDLISVITAEDRAALRFKKIKLGPILVFLPALNKPAAVKLRALLWSLHVGKTLPAATPPDGSVSIKIDRETADRAFYQSIGYPVLAGRAIRIDMLDRVISAVYDSAKDGKFQAKHEMAEWLGCGIDDLYEILEAMGHRQIAASPAPEPTQTSEAPPIEAPSPESVAAEPETTEAETPIVPPPVAKKPELAFFRLKRGKASDKPYTPRPSFSQEKKPIAPSPKPEQKNKPEDPHKEKDLGKREKRRNPKGKEYKQTMMSSGPKSKPEDSPFAILEQLKKSSTE